MWYNFPCIRNTKKIQGGSMSPQCGDLNSVNLPSMKLNLVPTQKQTAPLIFYNLKE